MLKDILSNMIITRVLSASTIYTPKNAGLKRILRPQWAFVLKYEGQTVYTLNGKSILSDFSHVVLLPKGCSYDWQCTESGHCVIIEFECEQTAEAPICLQTKHGDKFLKQCKALEYKRNLRRLMFEQESIKDLYAILISLAQSAAEQYLPSDKQEKITPALEYISQHYNAPITNDTLAALSGVSTVYFRKLFTLVTGVSPIVYARQIRIEKAKEMLKSDYGTLSDLALSLGYPSLYDFSRDFKKHTGAAPSKYEISKE